MRVIIDNQNIQALITEQCYLPVSPRQCRNSVIDVRHVDYRLLHLIIIPKHHRVIIFQHFIHIHVFSILLILDASLFDFILLLLISDQNEFIKRLIVEVLKLHNPPLKSRLPHRLLIVAALHHHRLLQQLGGLGCRFCEDGAVVLHPIQSILLQRNILPRLIVRIPRAILNLVALLLAAHAPVSQHGLFLLTQEFIIFVLVLLDFMLAVLTAICFLGALAAAPPHLTRPLGFVGATAPIIVFFFIKVFRTLLTDKKVLSDFTTFRSEFLKPIFHLSLLFSEYLILLLYFLQFLFVFFLDSLRIRQLFSDI